MQFVITERAREFNQRHQVIDMLRGQRESGDTFVLDPEVITLLLQEVDLLQVVAQAAEHVAAFPCGEAATEPLIHLRNSLRRWKE
jgi:hypothetical protein